MGRFWQGKGEGATTQTFWLLWGVWRTGCQRISTASGPSPSWRSPSRCHRPSLLYRCPRPRGGRPGWTPSCSRKISRSSRNRSRSWSTRRPKEVTRPAASSLQDLDDQPGIHGSAQPEENVAKVQHKDCHHTDHLQVELDLVVGAEVSHVDDEIRESHLD